MKRLREYTKGWLVRAIVILVVPGALWIWIAWCLLRAMHIHRSQA
jgi:uncharacterized membrane protein